MHGLRGAVLPVLLAALPAAAQQAPAEPAKAAFRVGFAFDFRNTYVNGDRVRFYGFRLGAQRQRDLLAVGFYGLGDEHVQPQVAIPGAGIRDRRTDFDYTALSYERLLIKTERWQAGIPVAIGLGTCRRSYMDEGRAVTYSASEMVPIEATLHADYSLLRWVYFGMGAGYRQVLGADREATAMLSGWTWYGKLGLRLGALFRGIFHGSERDH